MKIPSPLQPLNYSSHTVLIKRDDLIDPIICGNKRRKISGYLSTHPDTTHIITFGGAYSNHLRAIAHIGKQKNIQTTAIVRGEELAKKPLNKNLQFCSDQGMEFHFVERKIYRQIKKSTTMAEVQSHIPSQIHPNELIIPEGGCGPEGLIGTHDIIEEITHKADMSTPVYFCIEAGTGTTAAGCIQAIQKIGLDRQTIVIPILHDEPTIRKTIEKNNPHTSSYKIITGYEHGGYAKRSEELLSHNQARKEKQNIHIEPTYSGKLMYAVDDLIIQGYFPENATIIIYHSGY